MLFVKPIIKNIAVSETIASILISRFAIRKLLISYIVNRRIVPETRSQRLVCNLLRSFTYLKHFRLSRRFTINGLYNITDSYH